MKGDESENGFRDADRGQLVLVAAAAIALALFPLVLAYLQLGYAGDVGSEPTGTDAAADLDRSLDRAVHDAAGEVDAGDYGSEAVAADAFRAALDADLTALETAGVEEGVAAEVDERESLAAAWVAAGGYDGPVAGAFPEPTVHGGVVVQERAGEPVVLAVALRIHVVTPYGVVERERVVRVPG